MLRIVYIQNFVVFLELLDMGISIVKGFNLLQTIPLGGPIKGGWFFAPTRCKVGSLGVPSPKFQVT